MHIVKLCVIQILSFKYCYWNPAFSRYCFTWYCSSNNMHPSADGRSELY